MSSTQAAVPADDVRRQLKRILDHSTFHQAARVSQMLRFIVEETLAGRGAELKQYTVAVRGLGLPPQFDPQDNALIRIHARRLRQILEHYYQEPGRLDPVRITLDRGSYVPLFRWNTIPVAVPALDDAAGANSADAAPAPAQEQNGGAPVIAVIEFANLGMAEEWRYFAAGLAEELMMALAQSPGLAVLGPLERGRLAAEQVAWRDLNTRYGANFALDGSVQPSADALKVRVRLLDGASGIQVWGSSYRYDPQQERLLDVEQAIVNHVCQFLGQEFGVVDRYLAQRAAAKPISRLNSYEAILRARFFLIQFTEESLLDAIAATEHAVQIAPNSAIAWGGLSLLLAEAYLWPMQDTQPFPTRALACAERALQLDAGDPWVMYTAGYTKRLANDPEGDALFRRLLTQPCPPALLGLAAVANAYAKIDNNQSLDLIERAQALNPHYPRYLHFGAALVYFDRGEDERALYELDAQNLRNHYADSLIRAAIYCRLGRDAEAQNEIARVLQIYPNFPARGLALLARYYHRDYLAAVCARLAPLAIGWLQPAHAACLNLD
jgi:TolB-like protein